MNRPDSSIHRCFSRRPRRWQVGRQALVALIGLSSLGLASGCANLQSSAGSRTFEVSPARLEFVAPRGEAARGQAEVALDCDAITRLHCGTPSTCSTSGFEVGGLSKDSTEPATEGPWRTWQVPADRAASGIDLHFAFQPEDPALDGTTVTRLYQIHWVRSHEPICWDTYQEVALECDPPCSSDRRDTVELVGYVPAEAPKLEAVRPEDGTRVTELTFRQADFGFGNLGVLLQLRGARSSPLSTRLVRWEFTDQDDRPARFAGFGLSFPPGQVLSLREPDQRIPMLVVPPEQWSGRGTTELKLRLHSEAVGPNGRLHELPVTEIAIHVVGPFLPPNEL